MTTTADDPLAARVEYECRPEVAQLWGDGPVVYRALERLRPAWRAELTDDQARRLRSWRAGSFADLAALDRITIALDLTLIDVELEVAAGGECMWTRHSRPGWNVPEHLRIEAALLAASGEPDAAVGRRFGVAGQTIREWRERYV